MVIHNRDTDSEFHLVLFMVLLSSGLALRNKLTSLHFCNQADVYIQGHRHKGEAAGSSQLSSKRLVVIAIEPDTTDPQGIILCFSWVENYRPKQATLL